MKINPWFRCACGKLHIATHIWGVSRCKCGRDLKPQIPIRRVQE